MDFCFIQWMITEAQIIADVASGSPLKLALVSF